MEKKWWKHRRPFIVVCSCLSAIALSYTEFFKTGELLAQDGRTITGGGEISILLLSILLYQVYSRQFIQRNRNIVVVVLSMILSVCMVIGDHLYFTRSLFSIFSNGFSLIFSCGILVGYFFVFYAFILFLFRVLESIKSCCTVAWLDKYPFWFSTVLLWVAWMPYLIILFPGTIGSNGIWVINEFFGYAIWSNHIPFLTAYIQGGIIYLGRLLFQNDQLAMFLYIVLQYIFAVVVFANLFIVMKKWKTPHTIRYLILGYLAIFPIFPGNICSVNRDTLYFLLFVLFIESLMLFETEKEHFFVKGNIKWLSVNLCSMILLCLLRNETVYVLLGSMVVYAIIKRRNKKMLLWIVTSTFIMLCSYFAWNKIVMPSMGIVEDADGFNEDAVAILTQQTGRYAVYHWDEVTEDEYNTLSKFIDYDKIRDVYNSDNADGIKNFFTLQNGTLREYLSVWKVQLKKHPFIYVESLLCGAYGYFYPNYGETPEYLMHLGVIYGSYEENFGNRDWYTYYDFGNVCDVSWRNGLKSVASFIREIPIIGLLYAPGTYFWIVLIAVGWLFYHGKGKSCGVYLPIVFTFLTCMISPVNGLIRYTLPVMAVVPLILMWSYRAIQDEEAM